MPAQESPSEKAWKFFDQLWQQGDHWELQTSQFEEDKYQAQLNLLRDRSYERALEIGCGSGCFTRPLADLAERVLAIDIAPTAIERARQLGCPSNVEFRNADIMDFDIEGGGPWELIVLSEIIYYLGWLHSFFDIGWLAATLLDSLATDGRLLLANTSSGVDDSLLRPWLIRTYRDLFLNVGFELEREALFKGVKHGVEICATLSVFRKPAAATMARWNLDCEAG